MKALRWVGLVALVLLPIQAEWFAVIAAVLGIGAILINRRIYLGITFLTFGLLGAIGQLFATEVSPQLPERPDFIGQVRANPVQTNNLISMPLLYDLAGWNSRDGQYQKAIEVEEGFWRIPRTNPKSGLEHSEFFTPRWYRLEAGQIYTQSFYLRHDGTRDQGRFTITFFTKRGHQPAPTTIEQVAPQTWRVSASYTAQEGDQLLRALDFFSQGGDFNYLEVGWGQLEISPNPTPFVFGRLEINGLSQRLSWWVGIALMGFLTIQAGVLLLRQITAQHAAIAVLFGLGIHLTYVFWQLLEGETRATGLTIQPNILGHGMVVLAGLVWTLGGRRLGALSLTLSATGVWASGSRAALWGLLVLILVWCWHLPPNRRWYVISVLALLLGLFSFQPTLLGRLSQSLTVDINSQTRLQFWEVASNLFQMYPIGGIGFGNFSLFFQVNLPQNALDFIPTHTHNLWLQFLAEGGLFAASALGILLTSLIMICVRTSSWELGALLIAVLVLNFFDFTLFTAWSYYPLMIAVASLIKLHNIVLSFDRMPP